MPFPLANLEFRQHDSLLARQDLPLMMDPSAWSQFRALCYRQTSARIRRQIFRHASAWSPRLPLLQFVSRSVLAKNALARLILPFGSSLGSRPTPSSVSSSPALSLRDPVRCFFLIFSPERYGLCSFYYFVLIVVQVK
jgi:hypothetical protein